MQGPVSETTAAANVAWCKRSCSGPQPYHCRARGRTPAGYGPLQPTRAALTLYI